MAISLSFNRGLIDKPNQAVRKSSSSLGWRAEEVDLGGFINHVRAGYAFAPEYKGEHRKGGNFVRAGFIAADFDEGVTLDAARDNAFINSCAAFIYTTASHTDEEHRFRVVFFTESVIENAQDWADANLALAYKLGSDLTTSDKARCFFGNRAATFWELGHVLPSEKVHDLVQSGRELRAARTSGFAVDSAKKARSTTLLRLADGQTLPLSEIRVGASVYCPNHDDTRPSAFIVKSSSDDGIGIHCRACRCTSWQDNPDEYDFDAFDKTVEQRVANPLKVIEAKTFMEEFFPPEPDCFVSQDRFLAPIDYAPGVTLVKSPKGTGKTTVLKHLLSDIEARRFPASVAKKERAKTVLLIGHRRALLREAAGKLHLPYWSGFQDAAQAILTFQAQPLARIPKLEAQILLTLIASVAGVGDSTGLLRDAEVTALGLSGFADLCSNNKTVLEHLLGRKVRDDVKTNPIRQLNAFLGLGGLKLEPATRRKKQKKSVRGYAFNPEKFDLMVSLARAFRNEKSVKKELEEARVLLREAA